MEQYYEQTVQKIPTLGEKLLAVLVWVGAVSASVGGFYLMMIRFPQYGGGLSLLFFMIMVIMLALLYTKRLSPEFYYEYTGDWVSIDKILKKGTRQTLTRINFSRITAFGKYTPAKKRSYKPYHTYSAYTGRAKKLWYSVCLAEQGRKDMVIFEPDEQMLELIKQSLPVQLRLAAFGKGKEHAPQS